MHKQLRSLKYTADSAMAYLEQAIYEFKQFDWHQFLQPADVGRWPILLRFLILLVSVVLMLSLAFVLSRLLAPKVSVDEFATLQVLEEKVRVQRASNLSAATQQLQLERQSIFAQVLLQQGSSEGTDITQTMDVIKAAANASGVQLMSVTPKFMAGKDQAIVELKAQLELASLSTFWFVLLQTSHHFSLSEFLLELTEKAGVFELSLELTVPVAVGMAALDSAPTTIQLQQQASLAASKLLCANSLDKLCSGNKGKQKSSSKGFLLRSAGSEFRYLVRDNKGHLRGVEE
jgi:hypothetical protein